LDNIADNSIDAVVQVLLLMVFADRKAWDEELEAVRVSLPKLAFFAESESDIEIPQEGLDKLIIRHAARVRVLIDEEDLMWIVDRALRRITDPLLAPLVLSAMREIAVSDTNIHNAENDLIKQAESIWNQNA